MTPDGTNDDAAVRDKALLALALLAQTGRPTGAAPNDTELLAWREDRLSGARCAEVESHLASDPAVLQRLRTLVKSNAAVVPLRPPHTAGRRWRSGAWALAAAACVGLLALGLLLEPAQQTPTTTSQPPVAAPARPADAGPDSVLASAFARSYRNPSLLDRWFDGGGQAMTETCQGDCENVLDAVSRFGALVARGQNGCRQTGGPSAGIRDDLAGLRIPATTPQAGVWRTELGRVQTALMQSDAAACRALDRTAARHGR